MDGVGLYYKIRSAAMLRNVALFWIKYWGSILFSIFFYDAHKLVLAKYEIFKS